MCIIQNLLPFDLYAVCCITTFLHVRLLRTYILHPRKHSMRKKTTWCVTCSFIWCHLRTLGTICFVGAGISKFHVLWPSKNSYFSWLDHRFPRLKNQHVVHLIWLFAASKCTKFLFKWSLSDDSAPLSSTAMVVNVSVKVRIWAGRECGHGLGAHVQGHKCIFYPNYDRCDLVFK